MKDALQALRDADPARDVADGTWEPPTLDLTRSPRGRWVAATAATAAVLVAATGIALVTAHREGTSRQPVASSTLSSAASDPHLAAMRDYVHRLARTWPTLPGAVAHASSPERALDMSTGTPGSTNVVRERRWWTAPGTVSSALAWYASHLPSGTTREGSASGSDPRTGEVRYDIYAAHGIDAGGVTVNIGAVAHDGGVAVQLDVVGLWVPSRTPAETITNPSSVEVVMDRRGREPTIRRTLGRVEAAKLAAVVNGLQTLPPGTYHCPVDQGGSDRLTFTVPTGGPVVVEVPAGGCRFTSVTVAGTPQPTLANGFEIDRALIPMLGLRGRGY